VEPDLITSWDDTLEVATLTINRPHASNALTWELGESLGRAIVEEGERARCILVRASGSTFCAGVDLDTVIKYGHPDRKAELRSHVYGSFQSMITAIVECPVPVIGVLQGPCLGVGADLALSFDLRVGSTKFWFEETWTRLGTTSALGGGYFLPKLLGSAAALDLLLMARRVTPDEALRVGILQYLVAPAQLDDEVSRVASRIAQADPDAIAATKRLVRAPDRAGLREYMSRALEEQVELIARPEFAERVAAIQTGIRGH
jgi:2-(1,2-epoxy-1,2-dihydrophenyl)acetyl-CoA isomerase